MIYILLFLLFLGFTYLYIKFAARLKIVDTPNERSSHKEIVVRGGGIVFVLSVLIIGGIYPQYILPVVGLLIIAIVSFLDDKLSLSPKVRASFHLVACAMLLYFTHLYSLSIIYIVLIFIFMIGILNAYNFMDGINGITGVYTLSILGGLWLVNEQHSFVDNDLLWIPGLSMLAFLYFNFRKRARCFAGDIGSVSIAFWLLFMLLLLIQKTENLVYIGFLTIYGIDTIFTIIQRIMRKENIFKAHRIHLYQILANEMKIDHRVVSLIYGILQFGIILLIHYLSLDMITLLFVIILPLSLLYCLYKYQLMKKYDLLKQA